MNDHEVPSCSDSFANNKSKELHSGSIPFGKNLVCLYVTNLKGFIAKQFLCQFGLFLKHEANVKSLFSDVRMMVFFLQVTVPSAAPRQLSQCVNPDQLKNERLENILSRCGKYWLTSLKFSFLMQMTKVYSSHLRSVLAQIPSIKDRTNGIGKPVFADKRSHLLHLICLFLVFSLRCHNGFSFRPTGLMCDGRSLASPFFFFRRLGGRGAFFLRFFRWIFHCGSPFYFHMNCLLAPGKVPFVIVGAHAIPYLAFFSLLCGFSAANLQWCRKLPATDYDEWPFLLLNVGTLQAQPQI